MTLGSWGEDAAAKYLKRKGYRILEQNYRCKLGEMDLIASIRDEIVFIEVKTRQNQQYGLPCEAVNHSKIRHLKRIASWYLSVSHTQVSDPRIDVVEILFIDGKPYLHHIENITG